jgi:hypothetical protein
MTSICFSLGSTFTKPILGLKGWPVRDSSKSALPGVYLLKVIRSGLIPGRLIGAGEVAAALVPINRILGSPAGIRTRSSQPVKAASVLPLDHRAISKPISGPLHSFSRGDCSGPSFFRAR